MPRISEYNLRSSSRGNNSTSSGESEDELNTTIMSNPPEKSPGAIDSDLISLLVDASVPGPSFEPDLRKLMEVERSLPGPSPRPELPLSPASDIPCHTTLIPQHESRLYDLPPFSGKTEEWPLFLASFKDTTDAFRYNERQNLMRLQKSLVGAAKEAVDSMLIYPSDVPNAIEELEFRFGRPDLLVRCQLNKVKQFPAISDAKMDQIISFSTRVRNVVAFLTSAHCQQHLSNPSLLEQLVLKLPANKQFEWAKHAAAIKPFPTIQDFSTWLSDLARIVGLMPPPSQTVQRTSTQPSQPRRVMHVDENVPKRDAKCFHCEGQHKLVDCKEFNQSLSVEDRWKKVKSLQLCFSCLGKGHNSMNCRAKKPCGVDSCRRYHHQSLHEEAATKDAIYLCRRVSNAIYSQLFKVLPVTLFGPNGKVEVFAMIDEGSAISMLEQHVANELGLKGTSQPLTLQWYGQQVTMEQSSRVSLEIAGHGEDHRFVVKNIRTIKDLNLPVQSFKKSKFEHLTLVPVEDYNNIKPVMLIGLDNVYLGVSTTIVQSNISSPIAAKTKLGWVAYGPTSELAKLYPSVHLIRENHSLNELHEIVTEYFSSDNFGTNAVTTPLESKDDIRARQIMEETTQRIGKRFQTGLLWKSFPPKLPNSYAMAEKRLINIEKKMSREPDFADRYQKEMSKYFESGYARKLSADELRSIKEPVWYLPHFAVQSPHKPEKLRIVFDAAATVNNISLNSVLLKGPEQAKPLLEILFKFRQGVIGVAADIREMFSQVQIRQADQHAQRFLWRNGDTSQPIQQFAMTSMIFGSVCSPCSAEYIKNRNAEEFKQQYPEAAAAIVQKHYVDDFVDSFQNEIEAEQICRQVVDINAEAGFNLRNFISNSNSLQTVMNGKSNENTSPVNMERQATTDKVLGMYWDMPSDTFRFQTKFHRIPQEVLRGSRAPTKRELLGIVMAVFDPYGLLADFLIFSKILVQNTWKISLNWDDPIPAEIQTRWIAWWSEFRKVKEFEINRCYSPNLPISTSTELHIFVDASQVAFSAVGYFRIEHPNGVDVAFVMGKTRTAPQKLMSIPRLELQAAVLGLRLYKLICKSHDIKIDRVIFWSDSRTVLYWIHSAERKYKPFVGHRIAEIVNTTCPTQWRWVPSEENAADEATRPRCPPKFCSNSKWINGPAFLKLAEEYWPTFQLEPLELLEEEIKPKVILHVQASNVFIEFNNFSSYLKLKRMTAWMLRFAKKLLNRLRHDHNSLPIGQLTCTELDDAEKLLCRILQREKFVDEISALKNGQPISRRSPLYALTPYLDEYGLLRVYGRMDEASCLPFSARRPILLPQGHIVTELITRYFHEKFHHQNTAVTINEIRQTFWIPHIRAVLKNVQRN